MIPTTSLAPESAQRPKKTSWLSSQGWEPSFIDEEEIVATMAAAMAVARVCSGQFKESRWEEEEKEDAGTRQWQCLRAVGRQRMT